MYRTNAIERKTSAGSERYARVIERGNPRKAAAATVSDGTSEIPDGYRPISMDAIVELGAAASSAIYRA